MDFCATHLNMTADEKEENAISYAEHHGRKVKVREQKAKHKLEEKHDNSLHVVTFDLEQVLQSPKLNVSSLFYKRKLCTYNLSVYSLGDKKCTNFMWHEATAGRGSCEIATCVFKYLSLLPTIVKKVVLYSDTCGGQNRNINFSMMCLHTVRELEIESIDHVFMESGHSQMEVDSVHSTIESACRNVDVYCPMDYYRIAAMARARDPYFVVQLDSSEVTDYKAMTTAFVRNRIKDADNVKVKWLQMKWMRYEKSKPNDISFRYDYDSSFRHITVNAGSRGRRPQNFPAVCPLFVDKPKISPAKFNDLVSLCDSLAIPRDYHSFYHNLPHCGNARDALAEPDVEEDSDNDGYV